MDEQIAIPRGENEAGSELEWIFPERVLAVSGVFGSGASLLVVAAEKMEQVGGSQFRGPVRDAFGIDQQRESDSCFFAKQTSIVQIAQADRG